VPQFSGQQLMLALLTTATCACALETCGKQNGCTRSPTGSWPLMERGRREAGEAYLGRAGGFKEIIGK